jgi:hypothetical protein
MNSGSLAGWGKVLSNNNNNDECGKVIAEL